MKEYLEKYLRQPIIIEEDVSIYEKLPLMYRGLYTIYKISMGTLSWAALEPKKNVGLVSIRKNRDMAEKILGLNCAVFLKTANSYSKEKMIEEGIPFVIQNKQIYLPFIGIMLSEQTDRQIMPVRMISYLTQKLLLCGLYEKWVNMTVTDIAEKMHVTKMSISRCFDEIQYLGIDVLGMKGKSRVICMQDDTKKLWENMKPMLRNPIIAKYELEEDIMLEQKAGISALCEFSLLSDNEYPTYAITKKDLKDLKLKNHRKVTDGDEVGCVVLELGYFINFMNKGLEDPLSILLTLTNQELEDERVNSSVNEMLEEYVWSKG